MRGTERRSPRRPPLSPCCYLLPLAHPPPTSAPPNWRRLPITVSYRARGRDVHIKRSGSVGGFKKRRQNLWCCLNRLVHIFVRHFVLYNFGKSAQNGPTIASFFFRATFSFISQCSQQGGEKRDVKMVLKQPATQRKDGCVFHPFFIL